MQTNKRSDQTHPVKQDSCLGDCFQKMFQGWNFFWNIYFDNLFEMPFRGPGISFENGLFLVGYQWVMGKICKGALVIYSQEDKKHEHQLKRI